MTPRAITKRIRPTGADRLWFKDFSRHKTFCTSGYFACLFAFHPLAAMRRWSWRCLPYTRRSACGGDGWCWANLQNTHFSGLTRKNPVFERSVLKYVSIKNRVLTPSGQKSRVCVNTLDRLPPRTQTALPFLPPHRRAAKPARQKRPTLACWPLSAGLPEEGIGGRERERRCVCVEKSLPRSCLQDQVRA